MRNHPAGVGCVAAETAAKMVEYAAAGHARECGHDHFQSEPIVIACAGPVGPVSQQSSGGHGHRKLGRRAESTILIVVLVGQRLAGAIEQCRIVNLLRFRNRVERRQQFSEFAGLFVQLIALFGVRARNPQQQVAEAWKLIAGALGEVGAAEERDQRVRVEKHGQWPATGLLREDLMCKLVDFVQIGPLFAVDLDIDEMFVHQRGNGVVLE